MKSNVCKIERGAAVLDDIFTECEKVAEYNDLDHKETLQLRLLCEELVNMLPSIISNFSGEFWIETQDNCFDVCLKVLVDNIDIATRERIIKITKDNKNASVVGITGRIRAVFDYMVMGEHDPMISPTGRYGFSASIDSQIWSLQEYRNGVQQGKGEKWDEYERSILVKLADDVIVGVKGKNVSIIIKKKFA